MAILFGVNRQGDVYSQNELNTTLQKEISQISKDLFEDFLEENKEDFLNNSDSNFLIDEFQHWFLEWKFFGDSNCFRDIKFFKAFETGEIKQIKFPIDEKVFFPENFQWNFDFLV